MEIKDPHTAPLLPQQRSGAEEPELDLYPAVQAEQAAVATEIAEKLGYIASAILSICNPWESTTRSHSQFEG